MLNVMQPDGCFDIGPPRKFVLFTEENFLVSLLLTRGFTWYYVQTILNGIKIFIVLSVYICLCNVICNDKTVT